MVRLRKMCVLRVMCLNKVHSVLEAAYIGFKQNEITGGQERKQMIEGDLENPSKRVTL